MWGVVIRAGSPSYLSGVQKNKIQLSFRPWFLRSKLESQRSHELLGDILSFEPLTKQLLNRQVLLDYRCPFGAGRQLSRQGHLIPQSPARCPLTPAGTHGIYTTDTQISVLSGFLRRLFQIWEHFSCENALYTCLSVLIKQAELNSIYGNLVITYLSGTCWAYISQVLY